MPLDSTKIDALNKQYEEQGAAGYYADKEVNTSFEGPQFEPSDFDQPTADIDQIPPPAGASTFDALGRPYFGSGITGTLKRYAWQMFGSPTSGMGAENWKKILEAANKNPWISGKPGGSLVSPDAEENTKRIAAGLFDAEISGTEQTTDATRAKEKELRDRVNKRVEELAKAQGINLPPAGTARGPIAQQIIAQDWQLQSWNRELQNQIADNVAGVGVLEINGEKISLLTPAVRAVQVGTSALLDLLQEPSIKVEQGLGAQKAMRDYVAGEDAEADLEAAAGAEERAKDIEAQKQAIIEEKGLNPLTAAFDPDIQTLTRENYGNLAEWTMRGSLAEAAARLFLPALQAYDTIRFFAAPGTVKQKAEALKNGWNEGRLLYSEFVSPAIEQEYKKRAAAGEDPQLLALELQNPWAELVGQLILDPLNVIGYFSKASKVIGKVDEMSSAVKTGGLTADAAFLNKGGDLSRVSTDADGIRAVQSFTQRIKDFFYTGDVARVFKKQEYVAGALNAAGNKTKAFKQAGNVATWVVGNLYKNGYKLDDVNDYFSALIKLSSKSLDEIQQGVVTLTHFPAPKIAFGQDFLETSALLRNLLTNEDGVMDVTKLLNKIDGAKGDWKVLGETLRGVLDDAAKFQYPSISEMKKAADTVKTTSNPSARLSQLAEEYKTLEKTRPGLVKMAELDALASVPKNFINRVLGNFYFSYNYGYATRNGMTNIIHVLADAGTGAYFDEAGFITTTKLDAQLGGWKLLDHPALAGFKTLPTSVGADKVLASKLAENMEVVASKRVFYKFFRQTMEQVIRPGVGLPSIDDFKAIGMTDTQIKHFTAMVRNNFGDVKKSMAEFNQVYKNGGPDTWRMLESYTPTNILDTLRDSDYLDDIVDLTKNPNATPEDVAETFKRLRETVKNNAKQALNDLPGKNPNTPLTEQIAKISKLAGSNLSDSAKAKLDVLAESGYSAHDKYVEALGEILKRNPNDVELQNLFIDLSKRAPDNEIRKITDGITDKTWEVQHRAEKGEDYQKLWAEITDAGDPAKFTGSTLKEFRNALWEYKSEQVAKRWAVYFDRTFSLSEQYAKKYGVTELLQEARLKVQEFRDYQTAEFSGMKIYKAETLESVAKEYGVEENAILNTMKKYDPETVSKFTAEGRQATPDELRSILETRSGMKFPKTRLPPPYVDGANPAARAGAETAKGMNEALDFMEKQIIDNWGMKSADNFDAGMNKKMLEFAKDAADRVAEGQLIAQKVASYWRDFALLPYGETTHMDHALSYIYPYLPWYSMSYKTWAQRLATDPQIVAAYAKFKDQMAALHKDSPEWWKYNVKLPEAMWGLNNGNPMYLNLEAAVWPLYGLTGTDFNDPQKRTSWFTSTVDDLGKFGPSLWSPINMAIAFGFVQKGEQEAAESWGGRMIPQTATLKAIQAQMGMTPTELDPAVQMFDSRPGWNADALDKYEESRALLAVTAMQQEGLITEEEGIEASYRQEGEIWDEAVLRATQKRAPGQLASFFLGVGFKARTEQDMEMDNFYQDYFKLKELRKEGLISPEQYKEGFNELRDAYPFMDTVLLGRRAGDGRDAAYAYNVISRIPPGMSSELYETVGIDRETAEKFYESGGDMTGWNEQERDRFMTAMIDLGAIVAIPANATRKEWTQAKTLYSDISGALKVNFGEDIQDKIDDYFSFDDKGEANLYMEAHPEVGDALDMQNGIIANNPLLAKYYGGIDVLDRYYTGVMYDKLEEEFGVETMNAARTYSATLADDERKQILKDNPKLKAYWDRKSELSDDVLRRITELGSKLPEVEAETYGDPQNPVQEDVQELLNPAPKLTAEQWQGALGDSMMGLIQDFAQGEDLSYSAEKLLDRYAERLGYENRFELLQDVMVAIQ